MSDTVVWHSVGFHKGVSLKDIVEREFKLTVINEWDDASDISFVETQEGVTYKGFGETQWLLFKRLDPTVKRIVYEPSDTGKTRRKRKKP